MSIVPARRAFARTRRDAVAKSVAKGVAKGES
jgi:hypothetical protein